MEKSERYRLKEVTRCYECINRLYDFGVGFIPVTNIMCGMLGIKVEPNDGCTFGERGDGGYVVKEYDVSIENRAAVNGYRQYF